MKSRKASKTSKKKLPAQASALELNIHIAQLLQELHYIPYSNKGINWKVTAEIFQVTSALIEYNL